MYPNPLDLAKAKLSFRLRHYAKTHDHKLHFFLLYLSLGILLSFLFNLGVFVLLVLVHFLLDVSKHNLSLLTRKEIFFRALRDSSIDIMFVFVALALGVWLHLVVGIGVAKGVLASRSTSMLTREGEIVGSFAKFLSKAVLGERLIKSFVHIGFKLQNHERNLYSGKPLGRIDYFIIGVIATSILLILVSPILFNSGYDQLLDALSKELIPDFAHIHI